jgi:Co/Zn/Cd efflux system component
LADAAVSVLVIVGLLFGRFVGWIPLSGRVRRFRYGGWKGYPGATQRYCLLFLPTDVLVDAAVSVLVIVGLLFGRFLGWIWMDPVAALCGAVVIAAWAYGLATPVPSSSI